MKALCLYFHMMLFVCQNFRKWNLDTWSKFAFGHIWQWKGYGFLWYLNFCRASWKDTSPSTISAWTWQIFCGPKLFFHENFLIRKTILRWRFILFLSFLRDQKGWVIDVCKVWLSRSPDKVNQLFHFERVRWSASGRNKEPNVWNNRWCCFNEVGVAVKSLLLHPKRKHSRPSQGRD